MKLRKEPFSEIRTNLSVCKKLLHYKKINSTQIKLKRLAEKNADSGLLIVADVQSGGYGRIKRKWSSGKGGLWFSMLLKPAIRPDEISKLALVIAVALNRVFRNNYGINTLIKWPNDILFSGKKMCGILVEMSVESGSVKWTVAGIGVNINNVLPKELANISVSLRSILGKKESRVKFLSEFLHVFDKLYSGFTKNGFEGFVKEYNGNSAFINEPIKVDDGFGIIEGRNLGIDKNGRLVLKTAQGLKKVMTGTVVKGVKNV